MSWMPFGQLVFRGCYGRSWPGADRDKHGKNDQSPLKAALYAAFRTKPERFKGCRSMPPELPAAIRIQPPTRVKADEPTALSSAANS